MRKLILLLLLTIVGSLGAWISNPVSILNEDARVMFAGENAVVYKNGIINLVYLEKGVEHNFVKLSRSYDKGISFVHTLIDTVSKRENTVAPTLSVNSQNECYIFYQKGNEAELQSDLLCAKLDASEVLTYTLVNNNVNKETLVLREDDYTWVFYQENWPKQLCNFQYFTNLERNNLADNGFGSSVEFLGADSFTGPLHSNDMISFYGAGPDGWPDFHSIVTTHRSINNGISVFPPSNPNYDLFPFDEVFLGGLAQKSLNLKIDNSFYPQSYFYPFGQTVNPDIDIVKVVIDGEVANYRLGNIVEGEVRAFTVYSSYPDALHPETPIGDSLWTNYITIKDTVWTDVQQFNIPHDKVIYIPAILWIKGNVAGKQVWESVESSFVTGNITYQNTVVGDDPACNTTDYFGLISDKNIIIKYKYRIDGEPLSYENSTGPNGNVWLYGAFAALGNYKSDLSWREDGVFTFEYQHPHGAPTDFYGISPFTGADTLFTFIDFHKYQFPPTAETPYWKKWPYADDVLPGSSYPLADTLTYPWYGTTDWPWLNPVWPEQRPVNINEPNPLTEIVYGRGTLHLWGSVAQMRKGLFCRFGQVNSNPDMGSWDPDNFIYGPSHYETRYLKDFKYDTRMNNSPFPYFPLYSSQESHFIFEKRDAQNNLIGGDIIQSNRIFTHCFVSKDNNNLAKIFTTAYTNLIYCEYSNDNGITNYFFPIETNLPNMSMYMQITDFKMVDNFGYLTITGYGSDFQYAVILKINFFDQTYSRSSNLLVLDEGVSISLKPCLQISQNHKILLSYNQNIYTINDTTLVCSPIEDISTIDNPGQSTMIFDACDTLMLFVRSPTYYDSSGFDKLYFCKGYLNGITPVTDQLAPAVNPFYVKNYPNPFNPSTTIEFNLPKKANAKLEIFNIKGQRVRTLLNNKMDKGLHKVVWNGTNSADKPVSSGIYFYKLEAGDKVKIQKVLLMK